MADCPYARCIQERRHIRRELLRWTKNMVFVVGLERVAEELMGRRRWKQYQDTLYSSTRSESASQPHHRLHPAFATACSNLAAGNVSQVGSNIRQASTGTPNQQQISSSSPLSGSVVTSGDIEEENIVNNDLTNHKNEEESSRIRPEEIKVEVEVESAQEVINNSVRSDSLSSRVQQQRPRQRRINENGEDEESNENQVSEDESVEKRLKLDESCTLIRNSISPLRQNERSTSTDSRANEETNSEGTKTEKVLDRIPGLLRVKKEEELQELPQQVNCGGGDTTAITRGATESEVNRPNIKEQSEVTNEFTTLSYSVNRLVSPPPEDWKPLDKCYFCLDGKLPHDDQPPLSPQSDSSSSSRSAESPMSVQVDPMAASVVAAALSGTYPTLLPQWCLPPRETPLGSIQGHQDTGQSADQPLDLSAKPKTQDNNISILEQQKIPLRMPPSMDSKSIFTSSYRPKPRLPGPVGVGGVPVVGGGRRTYTEEELQAALRDIQSGKLGTRRAAVIYGIPRSTLRNKVYKLAMERERDASLTSTHSHNHEAGTTASTTNITSTTSTSTTTTTTSTPNTTQNANARSPTARVDEADDKELSGAEEEKEVEKALLKPLLSLEDLVRFSALEGGGGESLRTLLQRGQETGTEWPGFEHANIGPYIQKMLAAAPFKGLESQEYRIPEVMRRLMSEDKRLNVNGDQSHSNLLHQSSQSQGQPTSQQTSQQQRLPMTNDDFNPSIEEEASDSGQGRAILKIPSYKPAGTPGSSKNNGEPTSAAFAQGFASASSAASPGLMERASPAFSGTSSPTNSLGGKGVGVNFRDVIAKSISSKFQEGQGSVSQNSASMLAETNPFKRGRYTPPGSAQHQQQQPKPQNSQENKSKSGSGGKGTRPKRGKYRNYDRDSLVEAVRAVQRGEMSVHRAGSYYGVPHSTLEYKVKERHLMRPRKRDQKQSEEKAKESSAPGSTLRPSLQDKKPPLKPQKPFNPGPGGMPGPNGMKMPFLDGMPHLPFAHPFNFWGPAPFMSSPFIAGAPNVSGMLPEQYFATQRMRGLQEQQRSAIAQQQQQQQQQQISTRDGIGTEPGTSNSRSIGKTTREIAESLYEGSGANGSFLDNLIRSSLETGMSRDQRGMSESRPGQQHHPEGLSSKALIDQLCRNSRRTPLPRMGQDSSEDESYRGPRSLPDRPERVPTVDLSPSPTDRARNDDQSSDRLTSPPTPLSISRAGSRDDDTNDRSSREREVHNGGDESRNKQQQQNNYPDLQNLYAVSTEKKSACDSKLIVDHSSQKTTQQASQQGQGQNKEFSGVSGLVVQLHRGYTGTNAVRTADQGQQNNAAVVQAVQEPRGAALTLEESVEQ